MKKRKVFALLVETPVSINPPASALQTAPGENAHTRTHTITSDLAKFGIPDEREITDTCR